MSEVVHSDEELKLKAEQMLIKENQDKEETDTRGRRSLSERIRDKFHDTVYGKPNDDAP